MTPQPQGSNTATVLGGCFLVLVVALVGLVECAAFLGNVGEQLEKSAPPSVGPPASNNQSPQKTSRLTVKVSGTGGLAYSGNYGTVSGGSRSVEGKVGGGHDTYEVPVKSGTFDFDSVSAVFQKREERGTLKVEIAENGRTVQRQETRAQYGVVSVNYSP